MINFSEDFRQEGIYIGTRLGKIETSVSNLHNIIKSLGYSLNDAIDLLKIDESILEEVKQKYKEKYGDE